LPPEGLEAHLTELHRRRLEAARDGGDPLPLARSLWPDLLLDGFQEDIVRSILDAGISEVFVKGCTKAGKGAAVGIAANLWHHVHEESKIILTSQRYQHALDVMFSEVAAWRKQMRYTGPGELRRAGIFHHGKHYLAIANPETGEGFSGHHGPATLFLFDEATAISDEFYDLAKTQAACIVALANPRTLSGWFRRGFPPDRPDETRTIDTDFGPRRCVTVSGLDCRNVKERKQVIPNQLPYELFKGLMKHPNPRWRDVFALGKFPEEDPERQVVVGSWLGRCEEVWHPDLPVTCFGLDVAASEHGDETVLAAGSIEGVAKLHKRRKSDTMETVGWVIQKARAHGIELTEGRVPVCVDMDGLGKGVGDRLAELGCWVIEFRGNATSEADPRTYANLRAESYGEIGRRLNPDNSDRPWALPPDEKLRADLIAPEKIYASDGLRFRLTPKQRQAGMTYQGETIHERLGRSPDAGDAVAYLYHAVRQLAYQEGFALGELVASTGSMSEPLTEEERADLSPEVQDLLNHAADMRQGR
jgi:hypothetical protein